MRPIDLLDEEHRLLESLLESLSEILRDAHFEDRLDAEAAAEVLELLERSFDGLHQDREERVLFPWLRVHAPAVMQPSLRLLMCQHTHERELLCELRSNLEAAAYGDAVSRDLFVSEGEAYLALQRRHVEEEEHWLLPVARALLERDDEAELLRSFSALEHGADAPRPRELRERIARLERRAHEYAHAGWPVCA